MLWHAFYTTYIQGGRSNSWEQPDLLTLQAPLIM